MRVPKWESVALGSEGAGEGFLTFAAARVRSSFALFRSVTTVAQNVTENRHVTASKYTQPTTFRRRIKQIPRFRYEPSSYCPQSIESPLRLN